MDRKTERLLIEKIQNEGCINSYSKLIKELNLYRDIYHFVLKYIGDEEEAEEITQETMFRAFRNIKSFDAARGRFRSWVFGIAIHQAYDRLNERKHLSLKEIEDMPQKHRSPEELLQLMEVEEALLEAIEELGDRYRRILLMFYVEGLSHKEIAERENITPNNAGTILNRAKEKCLKLCREKMQKKGKKRAQYPKRRTRKRSEGAVKIAELFSSFNERFLNFLFEK